MNMLAVVNIEFAKQKKLHTEIESYRNVLLVKAVLPKFRKKRNLKQLINILQKRNVHAVICNTKHLDAEFFTPGYSEYVRLKQGEILCRKLRSNPNAPVYIDSLYNSRYLKDIISSCSRYTSKIYVSESDTAKTLLDELFFSLGLTFLITDTPPKGAIPCPDKNKDCFETAVPLPYISYKPAKIPSNRYAGMLWECTRDENIAKWCIFCH